MVGCGACQLGTGYGGMYEPEASAIEQTVQRTHRQDAWECVRRRARTFEARGEQVGLTQIPPEIIEITSYDGGSSTGQVLHWRELDEPLELPFALGPGQTKMHVVHDDRSLVVVEMCSDVSLKHAATLPPANSKIEVDWVEYGPARQDQVSIEADPSTMFWMKCGVQAKRLGQDLYLIVAPDTLHALRDFLEQHDIGIVVPNDGNGARKVVATIESAHTLVDVPAHHP
jgi:hypothetical protein